MKASDIRLLFRRDENLNTAVLIVVVAGIAVRFAGLGHQSLWVDEGYTLQLTRQPSFGAMINTLSSADASDCYMPAYETLLYFWQKIFGVSETGLRALSAAFGSIALIACTTAAWRNWGKLAALWTAILASVSEYAIFYSQETRSYASLHAVCALTILVYLECRSPRANRAWRLAMAVLCGLAMWFNIFSVFFLVLLGLADLISTKSLRKTIALWWFPALAASTYLAWFAFLLTQQRLVTAYALSETNSFLVVGNLIVGLFVGSHLGPPLDMIRMGADRWHVLASYIPVALILTLAGLLLAITLWRNRMWAIRADGTSDDRAARIFLVGIAVIAAFVLYGAAMKFVSLPRHAFSAWPALMIALPALVVSRGRNALFDQAGLALLALLCLRADYNYFFDARYARDDYRGVGRYLAAETTAAPATRPILVFGMPYALRYYYSGPMVDAIRYASTKPGRLRADAGSAPRLLVVINRPYAFRADANIYLQETFAPDYREVRRIPFHYFQISEFVRTKDKGLAQIRAQ